MVGRVDRVFVGSCWVVGAGISLKLNHLWRVEEATLGAKVAVGDLFYSEQEERRSLQNPALPTGSKARARLSAFDHTTCASSDHTGGSFTTATPLMVGGTDDTNESIHHLRVLAKSKHRQTKHQLIQ